jgi:integrase
MGSIMAARIVGRLKARQVANAKPLKGKDRIDIADGGNLLLQCSRGEGGHIRRSWIFKYELAGKRHELGLGPTHTVSLAEARDRARALRQQLLDGVDPLMQRREQRQALIAERAKAVTFKDVASAYLDLHLDSFRNAKHRQQWGTTLATYVYPKIGHMTVADIGPADVLRVIEPNWNSKRETMSRVRQRIKKVLDYAAERQYRTGENPAATIASLPKGNSQKQHHAALPYAELPGFLIALRGQDGIIARALEFTVLTAARTGETRGATWEEIDFDTKTWTVPAERMKAGKEHRVPLSVRAVEILRGLPRHGDRVFQFNDRGMSDLIRRMRAGVTVHGMRSAFMDWAHEQTAFPKAVIDLALAHTIGDKVEAAYRRGDLIRKRIALMKAWGDYCASKPVPVVAEGSNVVAIGA